mgnify:FL=1
MSKAMELDYQWRRTLEQTYDCALENGSKKCTLDSLIMAMTSNIESEHRKGACTKLATLPNAQSHGCTIP